MSCKMTASSWALSPGSHQTFPTVLPPGKVVTSMIPRSISIARTVLRSAQLIVDCRLRIQDTVRGSTRSSSSKAKAESITRVFGWRGEDSWRCPCRHRIVARDDMTSSSVEPGDSAVLERMRVGLLARPSVESKYQSESCHLTFKMGTDKGTKFLFYPQ